MKTLARFAALEFGLLFTAPFVMMTYILMPVLGRTRSTQIVGGLVTRTATALVGWLMPRIGSPGEFSGFRRRVRRIFMTLGPLWRVAIEREEDDLIEFRIHYCPVTTMFRFCGLGELCKYTCAGDWVVARRNRDLYGFTRRQTIGTGGAYCSPTYCRRSPSGDPSEVAKRGGRGAMA